MKGKGETKNKNHFFPFFSEVKKYQLFSPNYLLFINYENRTRYFRRRARSA